MQIQFIGATETVTGSKHLITTDTGKNILLDCGMFQGEHERVHVNNHQLGFDPTTIDIVLLSHAHIDHSGLIPLMYKQHFRGKVYCTPATFDLCHVMLLDSAQIQEKDIEYINKKRKEEGRKKIEPLYEETDVMNSLTLFQTIDYNEKVHVDENISFHFTDVGHILGSAAVHIDYSGIDGFKHLTFTGDIGRPDDKILNAPEPFRQADYIICESTYGDRLHENSKESLDKLESIINKTCVQQKGKVIIPAFSLGRTQELVYALDILKNQNKIPNIKVFVDSPLSAKTTAIMRAHMNLFNDEIKSYIDRTDGDPFIFKDIKYITKVEDSKNLNTFKEPCIIISASGMAEAGRIKHHIKNHVEDSRNTILIVGYSSPGGLADRLKKHEPEVRIFGQFFAVNASVETLESFSAHGDYNEMLQFLNCQNPKKVSRVFLVHGDDEAKLAFKEKLKQAGFENVMIPKYKEKFDI
ncbi:MAG: MBL fold metallo-hydrolase [Chitinophagales bacterium]|nr:MBL fold metallo-hydrolase [Chitinophagales bacterium]